MVIKLSAAVLNEQPTFFLKKDIENSCQSHILSVFERTICDKQEILTCWKNKIVPTPQKVSVSALPTTEFDCKELRSLPFVQLCYFLPAEISFISQL